MSGTVGRRVWRALTAVLAALLLILAPAGHADSTASAQGRSDVQVAVAHINDAMAVPPSTRAAAGRTTGVATDAAPTSAASLPGARGACRATLQANPTCQTERSAAPARAPPLKD